MTNLTPEQLAVYRTSARKRQEQRQRSLLERQQQGWAIARQAALVLKEQYGVKRVMLFGSLLDVERMHPGSDIDLAVWGLNENDYLKAVAQLLDLSDFSIDLVEADYAPAKLLTAIESIGVEL